VCIIHCNEDLSMVGVRLHKYICYYRSKTFMVLLFHCFGCDSSYLRDRHDREIVASYVGNTFN
jgi:hypothetical protein